MLLNTYFFEHKLERIEILCSSYAVYFSAKPKNRRQHEIIPIPYVMGLLGKYAVDENRLPLFSYYIFFSLSSFEHAIVAAKHSKKNTRINLFRVWIASSPFIAENVAHMKCAYHLTHCRFSTTPRLLRFDR